MIGETTTVCTECGTDDVDEDEHKGDHTEVCPNCGDIKVRQMAPAASKINLGCGDDYREDWHNVDIQGDAADQRLDLEATPWPWPDDSFETALVDNVFEHITPRRRGDFLDECQRILKPGGEMIMRLPVPEVGVGWDTTHQPIPSWRWPFHSRWADKWEVVSMDGSCVGPGQFVPERIARLATRFWLFRGVDQVEIVVRPAEDRHEDPGVGRTRSPDGRIEQLTVAGLWMVSLAAGVLGHAAAVIKQRKEESQ